MDLKTFTDEQLQATFEQISLEAGAVWDADNEKICELIQAQRRKDAVVAAEQSLRALIPTMGDVVNPLLEQLAAILPPEMEAESVDEVAEQLTALQDAADARWQVAAGHLEEIRTELIRRSLAIQAAKDLTNLSKAPGLGNWSAAAQLISPTTISSEEKVST